MSLWIVILAGQRFVELLAATKTNADVFEVLVLTLAFIWDSYGTRVAQ